MVKTKCKHCGYEFYPTKKYKNSEYCNSCRKYHKNCEICGKEIFVQARTCSKLCAYELRKQSWIKTCGSEHNFSKNSSSRKKWEKKLLEKEGITNVWQREEVKEKCKNSYFKNLGVDNPSKSKIIKEKKKETLYKNYGTYNNWSLTQKCLDFDGYRKKMEDKGLWIPLSSLDEYQIYCYNVWQITYQNIKIHGDEKFKSIRNKNKNITHKYRLSIDHKFSISEGFKQKIPPTIIGSIINLDIITIKENSTKNKKCSISLNKLLNDYENFKNENKIN